MTVSGGIFLLDARMPAATVGLERRYGGSLRDNPMLHGTKTDTAATDFLENKL